MFYGGGQSAWFQGQRRRVPPRVVPCTALDFDCTQELLWAGFEDGGVRTYAVSPVDDLSATVGTDHMTLYSCFHTGKMSVERVGGRRRRGDLRVSGAPAVRGAGPLARQFGTGPPEQDSAREAADESEGVFDILPCAFGAVVATSDGARLYRRGGVSLGDFQSEGTKAACLDRVGIAGSHVFLGGASREVKAFDLRAGGQNGSSLVYRVTGSSLSRSQARSGEDQRFAVTRLAPCGGGSVLCAGTSLGDVHLLDMRMGRSVVKPMSLHSASVTAMCASSDGYTVVTAGTERRLLNQYDPNSPATLVPDPLVRAVDLRTMRPMPPVACGNGHMAPIALSFARGAGPTLALSSGRGGAGEVLLVTNAAAQVSHGPCWIPWSGVPPR